MPREKKMVGTNRSMQCNPCMLSTFFPTAPLRASSVSSHKLLDRSSWSIKQQATFATHCWSTCVCLCFALACKADPEAKRLKQMAPNEINDRTEAGTNSGNACKSADKKPASKEPPKDYIHVRARRGQATDSHSLAERARREKISERMKVLQDIVPGCNKVIGKASVLDEIINYIQSLQRQVEFLSMKLEAINAHMNNATVAFPTKDFGAPPYNTAPSLTLDPQTPREYSQGSMSDWLHMQIGSAYERVT